MEAPQHPAALAEAAHSAKTLLHASVQNAKVQDEWEPLMQQIGSRFPSLFVHIFEYFRISLSTLFRNEISQQTKQIAKPLKSKELVEEMLQQSQTLLQLRTQCGIHMELMHKAYHLFKDLAAPILKSKPEMHKRWELLERMFVSHVLLDKKNVALLLEALFLCEFTLFEEALPNNKEQILSQTCQIVEMISALSLEELLASCLLKIGKHAIKNKVKLYIENSNSSKGWNNEAVVGSEGVHSLEFLFLWACEKVNTWVKRIFPIHTKQSAGVTHKGLGKPLQQYFFECFLQCRTEQIYEIIWDYPDSIPCLQHFKACLDLTGKYSLLKTKVIQQIRQNLLIASLRTVSIISLFINTISILRFLDPSCTLLLQPVVQEFQLYLNKRSDAGMSIVKLITNKDSMLYKDLGKKYKLTKSRTDGAGFESDEDEEAAREWRPQFIYNTSSLLKEEVSLAELTSIIQRVQHFGSGAGAQGAAERKNSTSDSLSILINIIGKDKFLDQYFKMVAEKVIERDREGYNEEKVNIEFLKQRFGEVALLKADVMMRDYVESRRFYKAAMASKSEGPESTHLLKKVDPVICSRFFWPVENEEEAQGFFVPCGELAQLFDEVRKRYAEKKKLRKLNLVPQQGYVTLDVELKNGRSEEFTVKPIQAAIISLFDGDKRLTLHEICELLQAEMDDVQKELLFWVHHGLLHEVEHHLFTNTI